MQHCSPSKLVISLTAFVFATASLAADPQAVRYYEDALSRFNSGDTRGAIIQLKNSLQRDPGQLPAKILLGRAYLAMNNPLVAEEELVQAEKLGADPSLIALPLAKARNKLGKYQLNIDTIRPTNLPADLAGGLWVELGSARLASGDTVGSEIAFEEALKLDKQDAAAILGLASAELQRKNYAKAEQYCEQALAADPDNADAWLMMGSLEEAKGRLEAALVHYRRAQTLQPNHYRAAMAEATATLRNRQAAEAAGLFSKIVANYPWALQAIYLHSIALSNAGQETQAEAALQRAAELVALVTPADLRGSPRELLLAAMVTLETGQFETSFGFLDLYLTARPDDVAARLKMAELLTRLGNPLEAVQNLTKLANRYPDVARIHIALGDANSLIGDYATAAKNFETALSLTTASTELVSKLGFAQQQQGRTDLAIATMSRLVELAPGASDSASVFLGILYLNEGKLDRAGQVANDIVALHPENLLARNLQAAVAIGQGERAKARQILESVLNEDPDFGPAQINLIKLDIVEGRYAQAESALDALLIASPDNELAARTYAELAMAKNEPKKAVQHLERIRENNPQAVEAILQLADIHSNIGNVNDAAIILMALDKAAPDNLVVKLKLARLHLQRNDIDQARSTLLDATSLARSNLPQRLAVAKLQIRAGALNDAAQGLQAAMAERPEAQGPKVLMARVYAQQNRLAQADDLISEVVAQHPRNLGALSMLADVRLARGQTDDAIRLYRQAMLLADEPALAIGLYRALVSAGRNPQALDELVRWHQKHPGNVAIMRKLADHYASAGRSAEALTLYEQLSTLSPMDAEVHNNLANLLLPVDSERALQSALRAYELAPQDAAVLDTLGWMLVQLGDLERGLAHLREAVARNGRVPDIRYHLAVALEEYGNLAAAKKQLRLALELGRTFPGRDEAARRLTRLEATNP